MKFPNVLLVAFNWLLVLHCVLHVWSMFLKPLHVEFLCLSKTCHEIEFSMFNGSLERYNSCCFCYCCFKLSKFVLFSQFQILNPFYVFQIFSCILWYNDEYYYYATCIIIISCISLSVSIYQNRKVMNCREILWQDIKSYINFGLIIHGLSFIEFLIADNISRIHKSHELLSTMHISFI